MKGRKVVNISGDGVMMADPMKPSKSNLFIFGEISPWWGVNKGTVTRILNSGKFSEIDVFIASPGGSVPEAFEIHDLLRSSNAAVNVYLIGECWSAATIVACAGAYVGMSRQCVYMIHKAMWGNVSNANADDLRKLADVLEVHEDGILSVYMRKTGKTKEELRMMMAEETFMNADAALAAGFVDEVLDEVRIDWDLQAFGELGYPSWMDYYDIYDKSGGTLNVGALYVDTVINLLSKGLKDHAVLPSPLDNRNQLTMKGFLDRIFNAVKDFIPEDKRPDAATAIEQVDIMAALRDEVQNSVRTAVEGIEVPQAVALDADTSALEQSILDLTAKVDSLMTAQADMAKRIPAANAGVQIPQSNGAAPVAGEKPKTGAVVNEAQLQTLREAVRNGKMTLTTFKGVTGVEYTA